MREEAKQKLVNDWLKNIKLKPLEQLSIAFESKLKITLSEMIEAGLPTKMLNTIEIEDIKTQLDRGGVTIGELRDAGLSDEKLATLGDHGTSVGDDDDELDMEDPYSPDPGEDYIEQIRSNDASASQVRAWLIEGKVSESQLSIEFGWDSNFIERIRKFSIGTVNFPDVDKLPPLTKDATDIYFLGMPGSGKSTMLASFLAYANRIGKVKQTIKNREGAAYGNYLINSMTQGYLPASTATNFVNFIPVALRNPEEKGTLHHLNVIDMAGEKFKNVAREGASEFNKIKEYLKTKNRKCLIFVLDYFEEDERMTLIQQDQNLQMVLTTLNEELDIIKDTDTIYLIVTKADKFPVDDNNKQSFADKYIDDNYIGFLATAQEFKQEHGITLKSFPYSIGETALTYILKESDPIKNKNLTTYPKVLFDQITADSFAIRGNWFARLFG